MKTITFNRKKLHELKVAYNWAICTGKEQFEFEGHELLVSYAKYLIMHLENQFGTVPLRKVEVQ